QHDESPELRRTEHVADELEFRDGDGCGVGASELAICLENQFLRTLTQATLNFLAGIADMGIVDLRIGSKPRTSRGADPGAARPGVIVGRHRAGFWFGVISRCEPINTAELFESIASVVGMGGAGVAPPYFCYPVSAMKANRRELFAAMLAAAAAPQLRGADDP